MTKNSVAYTFQLNLAIRVGGFPVAPSLGYGMLDAHCEHPSIARDLNVTSVRAPLLAYVKRVAPHCSSAAIISLIYVPGAGHGARRIFDVACTDPPFAYAGEPADERVTIDFRRGDTFIAFDMHDLDMGEMGYGIPEGC